MIPSALLTIQWLARRPDEDGLSASLIKRWTNVKDYIKDVSVSPKLLSCCSCPCLLDFLSLYHRWHFIIRSQLMFSFHLKHFVFQPLQPLCSFFFLAIFSLIFLSCCPACSSISSILFFSCHSLSVSFTFSLLLLLRHVMKCVHLFNSICWKGLTLSIPSESGLGCLSVEENPTIRTHLVFLASVSYYTRYWWLEVSFFRQEYYALY